MTQAAISSLKIKSIEVISISTEEIERDGPSYTIDTIEFWRNYLSQDASLSLLIGFDQIYPSRYMV